MVEFPFERDAMKGEPLPKKLDVADSCLYVALKNLYNMYREGRMSRDEASEEKRRLVYSWTQDKSKLKFLSREALCLSKRISGASKEYKENPSVDTADKLFAAFYNLPDGWRNKDEK